MRLLQKPIRKYHRVLIGFSLSFSDINVFLCSKQIRFVVLKIRFCLCFRFIKGELVYILSRPPSRIQEIWQIVLRFEVKGFYFSVGLRGSDIWYSASQPLQLYTFQ